MTKTHPVREKNLRVRLLLGCLTPLLLAVVAQAVYTVSAQQHAMISGLEEKARSLGALMVDVVGPSVALDDPSSVKDGLAYVAKDTDFAFSAAIAPDGHLLAYRGPDDKQSQYLGHLPSVTQAQIVSHDDYVVVQNPLKPGTTEIGMVVVGLRTAAARAAVTHMVTRVLLIAGVGILIALLVVLLLASAVVKKNRDLKLIMDNMGQGFLSVTRDGALMPEHSKVLETWFGPFIPSRPLWSYLATTAPRAGDWLQLLWENVTADVLPLELALDQLPARTEVGAKVFDFSYKPIFDGSKLLHILVVISDVTIEIEQERAKAGQRELVSIFQWLLKDRQGLTEFFADADRLVAGILTAEPRDMKIVKRDIHTLKGNSGVYGLSGTVAVCHAIETRLEDGATELTADDRKELETIWQGVTDKRKQLLGDEAAPRPIQIDHQEHGSLIDAITREASYPELADIVRGWVLESAQRRLERIGDQARDLARRMEKGEITVLVEANGLRLPDGALSNFWGNFSHLIRNAVDHGLETPEERTRAGKSDAGSISLRTVVRSDQFLVEIEDDGRGIDWRKLAEKAKALGLPTESRSDLVEAIFSDGISTKDAASELSGRGVGMSALRAACVSSGGRVRVFSEPGEGTRFQFCWPAHVLRQGPALAAVSESLSA